jgi:hypothetical protein
MQSAINRPVQRKAVEAGRISGNGTWLADVLGPGGPRWCCYGQGRLPLTRLHEEIYSRGIQACGCDLPKRRRGLIYWNRKVQAWSTVRESARQVAARCSYI